MLRQTGPNAVESSEGFSVRRVSRHAIEYLEGDKRALIEVEAGDGLAIYRQSVKTWEAPHGTERLDSALQERIVTRVCAALDFLGIHYVLA